MRSRRLVVALCVAPLVLACGSGRRADDDDDDGESRSRPDAGKVDAGTPITDLTGFYDVTSWKSGDCGQLEPESFAKPYLGVDRLQDTFYVRGCSEPEESACGRSMFYDFDEPMENGMKASGGTSFFSAECTLSWERSEATLVEGELLVRSRVVTLIEERPEEECTLAAAEALTGPCSYEIEIRATKR